MNCELKKRRCFLKSKGDLFRHYKKDFAGLSIALVLSIVVNVTVALTPLVPQLLVDRVLSPSLDHKVENKQNFFNGFIDGYAADDFWGMFWVLTIIFLIVIIVKLIANYIRWQIANYYATRGETRLRNQVFEKMLSQNSSVLNKYTSGEMLSVCNSDISTMQQFYGTQIMYITGVVIFFGFSVYILSTFSPLLIIVPCIGGFITFFVAISFAKTSRQRVLAIRQARVQLNTTVQENIQGVRLIRSYSTEDIEQSKFDKVNTNLKDRFVHRAKSQAWYNVIFSTISQAVFFGSMILGIYLAIDGKLSAGQLAVLFTYIVLISEPFATLAGILSEFQNTTLASDRVFGFLNVENQIVDGLNPPVDFDKTRPHIKLNNVRVQAEDKTLVHDIDLDLPYGKRLGIMGKTGSGKTILIKALMRFYDCAEGHISLDGLDIKEYTLSDVRGLYGYVMQDMFLFSDTVAKNIAFFDPSSDTEKINHAAKVAQAHDFILNLSDGYDTVIGEKGVGLSGGQKQRVSMARAFLKNAPVLLFDDCTSALDMETERLVMDNISKEFGGRTLVIATHRASSVKNCDEIIFLDHGKIIERGTHTELMQLKGEYYNIYVAQQAMQEEIMAG